MYKKNRAIFQGEQSPLYQHDAFRFWLGAALGMMNASRFSQQGN